ncbi:hypothetical protein NQ176_g912 [Zarea fungicola]|uniref:Uncharacterized protein n=1 Tax=Zarea fungicola TaxID=93591 RepID=A0ACC1NW19_9HYPO|nr:hypothetical protein NQ176_g912 [Lecanicillium fungicola]
MLQTLPNELLIMLFQGVSKKDRKALSLVSRHIHDSVKETLWHSITIKAADEYRFNYRNRDRCPHTAENNEFYGLDSEDSEDSDAVDEFVALGSTRFDRLTARALSALHQFSTNQLESFSWDLGTCIPPTILGKNGVVTLNQNSLKHLSLATDSTCDVCYNEGFKIDLSKFCQLQSLRWRGPNAASFRGPLSETIRLNCGQLQELELDFVHCSVLWNNLDDLNAKVVFNENYFMQEILGLRESPLRPCFMQISTLSLSRVPLAAEMAHAINFDSLTSLTLRSCSRWQQFITGVLQLGVSIRLQKLEIQHQDSHGSDVIRDFLVAFQGLNDLAISESWPSNTIEVWNRVANHRATLKRFVYHQRMINIDNASPDFGREQDSPHLGFFSKDLKDLQQKPLENPLTHLNLEFIALACAPDYLKDLLLPFKTKNSLKVIHIRHSSSDSDHSGSWARRPRTTAMAIEVDATPVADPETEGGDTLNLQPRFREFAEWVFGPNGLPTVQFIVYGDFAYDGRGFQNLMLRKSLGGDAAFQVLSEFDTSWEDVIHLYGSSLGACPVEPFLGGVTYNGITLFS